MAWVSDEAAGTLEQLFGQIPEIPPVQKLLDATLESVDKGSATFSMEAGTDYHNVVRVTHGGILTSLAELAASTAIVTTLSDDEAFTFVSQTTNYERPVTGGRVEATARMVRRGRRISFIEVQLHQDDKEVSRAEFTALTTPIER